jgi:hypothetical protein
MGIYIICLIGWIDELMFMFGLKDEMRFEGIIDFVVGRRGGSGYRIFLFYWVDVCANCLFGSKDGLLILWFFYW